MKILIKIIFFISLIAILTSCKAKTVYVPVETIKTEKEYIDRLSRDSIHVYDSIFFAIKGDTIFLEKYKYVYKDKVVRDSIFRVDSIKVDMPYPVIEIKEVNKLENWQILFMCLGGIPIGYVLYKIYRRFR